jgi:hypothetical protein
MKQRICKSMFVVSLTSVLAMAHLGSLSPARASTAGRLEGQKSSTSEPRKLEGTWRAQITIRNCQTGQALRNPFPALVTFARGGTLTSADSSFSPALRGPSHGVWRHVSGHIYSGLAEAFLYDLAGAWTGTQRITQTIEIGENPNEFEGRALAEIFDANGHLLATGCATLVGHRME